MSALQKILYYFSWLTVLSALLLHLSPLSLPPWLGQYLLPVLLTAAIGFLTNFLAIEMLFKPYSPETVSLRRIFHADFWSSGGFLKIITLGIWRTGLVPANKAQIGKKLGEEIPRRLLNEEEISRHLLQAVASFPERHPDITLNFLRNLIRTAAESGEFQQMLLNCLPPHSDKTALTRIFPPEQLPAVLQDFCRQWFSNEENRRLIPQYFTLEAEKNLEFIRNIIRDAIQTSAAGIMQKQSPIIAMFGGNMIDNLLKNYDWSQLDGIILEKLHSENLQTKLLQACSGIEDQIGKWSSGENGKHELAALGEKLQNQLTENLADSLPSILRTLGEQLLNSSCLRDWMTEKLLPSLQTELNRWFREGGQAEITALLDLSRRIEEAVAAQDIPEFHRMVTDIADRHLNAIQILGFFIGLVIGLIQIL